MSQASDGGRLLTDLTQPEAAEALGRGTAVLVTGSVEQHGSHLPLGTDGFAALAVALRAAASLGAPVLQLAPVGIAPYHLPWPGTLSISADTFTALLSDVCEGLAGAGVDRVLLVNWHEGNTPAIRVASDLVQRRFPPLRVIVAETHVITNALFPEEMEFTHAGSMETAAVLAHDPSLVHLDRISPGDDVGWGSEGHALFRRRDVFPVMTDFREVAPRGWYGSPADVTEARAREIFDLVARHVVVEFESVSRAIAERDPGE